MLSCILLEEDLPHRPVHGPQKPTCCWIAVAWQDVLEHTPAANRKGFRAFASTLMTLIEQAAPCTASADKIVLCGHSMGGMVAAAIAALPAMQARVCLLVSIASPLPYSIPDMMVGRNHSWEDATQPSHAHCLEPPPPPPLTHCCRPTPGLCFTTQNDREGYVFRRPSTLTSLALLLYEILQDSGEDVSDPCGVPSGLRCTVLCISGEHDQMFPPEAVHSTWAIASRASRHHFPLTHACASAAVHTMTPAWQSHAMTAWVTSWIRHTTSA
jgi:pimeloyl-ACP methyl ester carboxylesterase